MADTLSCIIVDDEPLARELLRAYVDKTPDIELRACCESAAEANALIMEERIDLVFLDINMPLLNGMDFARLVPETTKIVFVTAYDRYALEGFKVNALDYILKPVSYSDFLSAVSKAARWKKMEKALRDSIDVNNNPGILSLKTEGRLMRLNLESILYIEVKNDRVIIFRKEGEPISSIMSLTEIEEILPDRNFMRVHRSFIVNLSNVEIVERNRIIFGKVYVPISESKREEFFSRL